MFYTKTLLKSEKKSGSCINKCIGKKFSFIHIFLTHLSQYTHFITKIFLRYELQHSTATFDESICINN